MALVRILGQSAGDGRTIIGRQRGQIRRFDPASGAWDVLASAVGGEPLDRPNDMAFDARGNVKARANMMLMRFGGTSVPNTRPRVDPTSEPRITTTTNSGIALQRHGIERFANVWHATPGEIASHYMQTMMG